MSDTIRWRLNDPAVEWRQRWTRVHVVSRHASDLTACHRLIPEHAYVEERNADIPGDAPRCRRCVSAVGSLTGVE